MIERYLEVLERHLVVADLKKEISIMIGIWLLWALVLTSLVFIFGDVGLAASFQSLIKVSVVKRILAVLCVYLA